jgi:predicted TPR repeat methyltransferase
VDLSARMLERARLRGAYDRIDVGELTAFLAAQPSTYDAVVSADTLCYFGELDGVVRAAWGALRRGGWFLFTVEALAEGSDAPYVLQPHGRYAHSGPGVGRCLAAAGFTGVSLAPEVLRREGGMPVQGWLVAARRPVDDAAAPRPS